MKTFKLIPALIASLLVAHAARAVVLYQDDFTSGSPASALNGTIPDTTTGSNAWNGSVLFRQDGANTVSSGNAAIWLPVTLAGNSTYEFTLDFDLTAASNTNWVGLGFTNNTDTTPGSLTTVGATWMILRRNALTSAWGGLGTAGGWVSDAATGLTLGTGMTLKLKVTTGATAANSTVDMFVSKTSVVMDQTIVSTFQLDLNGVDPGSTRTGVNLGGVTNIGIGASNTSGSIAVFQNFTAELTAIPEPSSWALILGGLTMVVTMAARRRR